MEHDESLNAAWLHGTLSEEQIAQLTPEQQERYFFSKKGERFFIASNNNFIQDIKIKLYTTRNTKVYISHTTYQNKTNIDNRS